MRRGLSKPLKIKGNVLCYAICMESFIRVIRDRICEMIICNYHYLYNLLPKSKKDKVCQDMELHGLA